MANLKNVIKKAEKLSGEKVQVNDCRMHFVNYKGYSISFYPNGRPDESGNVEATNFYTRRNDLKDDHQTDYFAGTFWDNISQCFAHIDRMVASATRRQMPAAVCDAISRSCLNY